MADDGRILVLTPTDPTVLVEELRRHTSMEVVSLSGPDELPEQLAGAKGLVIGSGLYGRGLQAIVDRGTDLEWIQLSASGFDVFIEKGGPAGVPVMRAVGVWGRSVAGHALALLMALMRRVPDLLDAQRQGLWINADLQRPIASLPGRRVMLLGLGDIGGVLAPVLKALGADLIIVASISRQDPVLGQIHGLPDLERLLPQAEIVIAALPSTEQTIGLLNAARLGALPPEALLVNVGRGDLIDENALARLLSSGHLGGAAMDVFAVEPLPAASPLWSAPNLIISPHVAAFGDRESLIQLAGQVSRNIGLIAAGQAPDGLVGVGKIPRQRL